jgi:MFS family permease
MEAQSVSWQIDRRLHLIGSTRLLALIALIACAAGCAIAPAPIKDTPQIVATPESGQVNVTLSPAPTVGNVQPVFVSIANGTDMPRSVVPSQVFALNEDGDRVAPLPPGEAARQAGNANELTGVMESSAVGGILEGAIGAGVGAIVGSVTPRNTNFLFGVHGAGNGAAVGGAIGAGHGLIGGGAKGQGRADQQASQQLGAVALTPAEVRRDFTVSGYVFFPKGDYKQLQVLLVDGETGNTEVIDRPWK